MKENERTCSVADLTSASLTSEKAEIAYGNNRDEDRRDVRRYLSDTSESVYAELEEKRKQMQEVSFDLYRKESESDREKRMFFRRHYRPVRRNGRGW